jgi:predicted HAD superfamily Cof-like phosphohydrolase
MEATNHRTKWINSQLFQVRQFHEVYGLKIEDKPVQKYDPDTVNLRKNLVREEFEELMEALDLPDGHEKTIAVADALADLLYVVHGTAVSFGIPLDQVFEEVQRSNMSKLDDKGNPIVREDGKILKGPNFREPNIAAILWPVPYKAW